MLSRQLLLSRPLFIVLAAGLSCATTTAAGDDDPWLQQAKLVAADGAEGDRFGSSVALDGDTAVVSAPFAAVDGDAVQGVAYVLVRDGEEWVEQGRLTAQDGAENDTLGEAVAISGDTILVGARKADVDGNSDQGAVYVFTRNGDTWSEQAKLTAADGDASHEFGASVALFGDTALVGAKRARVDGFDNGAAYIFTRDGAGAWTQLTRLQPDDWPFGSCTGVNCPRFGYSVALWGDTALVGARNLEVDGVSRAGAAYVFVLDQGEWTQQAKLTRSEPAIVDFFGASVALRGDIALIGAIQTPLGPGAVHIFTRTEGLWSEWQELTASDGANGDAFGASVALLDGTVLVGAEQVTVNGNSHQGAAYVFTDEGGTWNEQQKLIAADGAAGDRFGTSLALSNGTALVGASGADINGNSGQGAAYVFVSQPAGDPPDLAFSPPSLNFGEVEVGATSEPLDTTLSNSGDNEATGLDFSSPGSGFSVVANECGSVLPAGDNCLLSLTFSPAAAGPASDTLTVEGDDGISASLALSGTGDPGAAPPGELDIAPAVLDFGEVVIGTLETRTLTVGNVAEAGAGAIELDTLAVTAGAPEFAITDGTCQVGSVLPPGGDCTVDIAFQPAGADSFAGQVTVTTADGQAATAGAGRR